MKRKRLILSMLIATIVVTFTPIIAHAKSAYDFSVETQTPEFYINDFADVFSKEEEKAILEKASSLDKEYEGIQVVVSTVNSLQGHDISEYAYAMYNQYGIGKDSMGILILLSVGDRDVRIETGNNMQRYFTDSMSGRILDDYGMEYFKNDNFALGLISVQDASISKIKEVVPADWQTDLNSRKSKDDDLKATFLIGIVFIGIVAFIILIYLTIKWICKLIKNAKIKEREKQEAHDKEIILANDKKWENKLSEIESRYNQDKESDEFLLIEKNTKIKKLELRNKQLEDKIEKVLLIHPNVEQEIEDYTIEQNKKQAIIWDNSVKEVLELKPSKDNVKEFYEVLSSYDSLSTEVSRYVKTDMDKVHSMYSESQELLEKHNKEEKRKIDSAIAIGVSTAIAGLLAKYKKGDYNNYDELKEVNNRYNNLTKTQKNLISDKDVISRFFSLFKESSADYQSHLEIQDVIDKINGLNGSYLTLSKVQSVKDSYDSLSDEQKVEIPQDLYDRLLRLLRKAQENEDDDEDDNSNIRRNHITHTSHSTPRTSHTGHGGRSGGGGASRHF